MRIHVQLIRCSIGGLIDLTGNSPGWIQWYVDNYGGFRKISDASDNDLRNNSANGSSISDISRVIYNGYGYNTSGIKEKYGLSDNEFRAVTQAAVWYFTDGTSIYYGLSYMGASTSQNMINAGNELVNSPANYPSSLKMDLYVPVAGHYQNLLAIRITEDGERIEEYNNPNGKIGTTVKAGNSTGSATKEASVSANDAKAGVAVVDTVKYEGLVAGEKYTVTGTLYLVENGQVTTVVATKTETKTATAANGEWEIDFGTVTLEPGKKYVVYETAISENNLVDTDGDNTPDAKQTVEHKDPTDKAQTVVTKKPNRQEVPNTGDSTNVTLWFGTMFTSFIALFGMLFWRKKYVKN